MAQKRMISRSLALSRKVNRLPMKHELIYVRCIPFLGDWGDIDKDPDTIKAMVFPKRKEISEDDIKQFIRFAKMDDIDGEPLVEEYSDCLHFVNFEEWNTLNPERRAKSRFKKIPENPLKSPKIPEKSLETPIEGRRGEVRVGKERDATLTPAYESRRFFEIVEERGSEFDVMVAQIASSTGATEDVIAREVAKFCNYWREKNKTGTKELWETKPTFEVKRRLSTWFGNVREFSKSGVVNRFTAEIV